MKLLLRNIRNLAAKERVDTWVKLLEYSIPKLQRTETRHLITVEDLLSMTPDKRKERIMYLNSKLG